MNPPPGNPAFEREARRPLTRNRTWLVVVLLLLFAGIAAAMMLLQSPPPLR